MAKRHIFWRRKSFNARRIRFSPLMESLDGRVLLSVNPIVAENQLPGTDPSVWLVPEGQADSDLEGYTTAISVDVGQTVSFKVTDVALDPYEIDIYRIGYYQGNGPPPRHNDPIYSDLEAESAGADP